MKDEALLAGLKALDECVDRLRLVAGRLEVRNNLEEPFCHVQPIIAHPSCR